MNSISQNKKKVLNLEYLFFETKKEPTQLAERIRGMVQQQKLGDKVLRFYVQKGASHRDPYWAFLAVLPNTVLSPVTLSFFKDIGIHLHKERLSEKEVSKMLSKRYLSLDHPDPILAYYTPPQKFSQSWGPEISEITPTQTEGYNQLLYWLSVTGMGSWNSFHAVCEKLQLAHSPASSRYILRELYLLGHLEISPEGSHWSISPSGWVQNDLEDGGYWAGRRLPQQGNKLTKIAMPNGNGPERWGQTVPPDSAENAGKVAENLFEILPDVQGWKNALPEKKLDQLVNYQFERWNGQKFEKLEHHQIKETALYRVTPNSRRFVREFQLYFDANNKRWLQADWNGLRFLSDWEMGNEMEWIYLTDKASLCLPLTQRPPRIYEKVLVLASGYLPYQQNNWLYYQGISENLVKKLSQKLDLRIRKEDRNV